MKRNLKHQPSSDIEDQITEPKQVDELPKPHHKTVKHRTSKRDESSSHKVASTPRPSPGTSEFIAHSTPNTHSVDKDRPTDHSSLTHPYSERKNTSHRSSSPYRQSLDNDDTSRQTDSKSAHSPEQNTSLEHGSSQTRKLARLNNHHSKNRFPKRCDSAQRSISRHRPPKKSSSPHATSSKHHSPESGTRSSQDLLHGPAKSYRHSSHGRVRGKRRDTHCQCDHEKCDCAQSTARGSRCNNRTKRELQIAPVHRKTKKTVSKLQPTEEESHFKNDQQVMVLLAPDQNDLMSYTLPSGFYQETTGLPPSPGGQESTLQREPTFTHSHPPPPPAHEHQQLETHDSPPRQPPPSPREEPILQDLARYQSPILQENETLSLDVIYESSPRERRRLPSPRQESPSRQLTQRHEPPEYELPTTEHSLDLIFDSQTRHRSSTPRHNSPIRQHTRRYGPENIRQPSPPRYELPVRELSLLDVMFDPQIRQGHRYESPTRLMKIFDAQIKPPPSSQIHQTTPFRKQSSEDVIYVSPFDTPGRLQDEEPGIYTVDTMAPSSQQRQTQQTRSQSPGNCRGKDAVNDPSAKPMVMQPKCPQRNAGSGSSNKLVRRKSRSKSRSGSMDYIPIWYQKAGSKSSDWFDGSTYYQHQHDPSNQTGAFAPHVDVETTVKIEKARRKIPNQKPYSNEDFSNSKKKKHRKDSRNSVTLSLSNQESKQTNYVVNFHEASQSSVWNYNVRMEPTRKATARLFGKKHVHIPDDCAKEMYPYSSKATVQTESSVYNMTSVSSGIAPSAVAFQAYNASIGYAETCDCPIDNCKCLYKCTSRNKAELTNREDCLTLSELSACSRGEDGSLSNVDKSGGSPSKKRGRKRRDIFMRRRSSGGDLPGSCSCDIEDCYCIYEPCASRKRGKKKLKPKPPKPMKPHKYKPPSMKALEHDKCFLCHSDAIEIPFNWCMRMFCVTWVWSEREFKRHCGKALGPLPDYTQKPPSLNESWLQRWWSRRYVGEDEEDGDGDEEGEND